MDAPMLTHTDIIRRRLAAQFLTTRGLASASDVVRTLGAVQAQDYAGAKWALGQRVRGATDASVEREMTEGRLIRTHVLRPTWHFVPPEDLRWMLALTASRITRVMASYNKELDLDARTLARGTAAIARALEGGKHLTRPELATVLGRARVGPAKGQRLARLVMQAELGAVICSGPRRGNQFTYALIDERAPRSTTLDRDEALATLARRYFTTRGPASAHDFAWWSGLTVADARHAVALIAGELERATYNDRDMWFVESAPPRARAVAHLLPNYDEYFIGYKDRSAIGRRTCDVGLVTGGNALIAHVVTVNGELVGGWKRAGAGAELRIVARVSATERALIATATRRFTAFALR
jgi:hypothetical protein